ncbi:MAG TPA: uracil-DNA glycosylase family protein [Polyangium sp.]|jgi:DNA polymerase|nr:uracil-DNA glycosylase family protein [Polyangium sp.]
MSDEPLAPVDARHELFELATSVRALIDWYDMTGVTGVPRGAVDPEPIAAPMPQAMRAPMQPPTFGAPAQVSRDAPRPAVPNSFEQQPSRPVQPPSAAASFEQQRPPLVTLQSATPAPAARAPVARAEVLTPTERVGRLSVLATEVASCQRCGLAPTRTQTVFSRGDPFAELCFVGEGPGADEDRLGEPFVGAAGQLLDRMIAAMGYRRDEVYICNIVKCRPPGNRKPTPEEMDACKPYLVQQIELGRPKCIVALGATAIQGLMGTTEGIMKLRGKWKLYRMIPVMPTFHPAYLLRQPEAKKEVWEDLKQVMARLGKPVPPPRNQPANRG